MSDDEQRALKVLPTSLSPLPAVEAIVIQAGHDEYAGLDLALFPGVRVILDGRCALTADHVTDLRANGMRVLRIGAGRADASS